MESRKFKQTRIPKSGIVKSKLDGVRKRLLRNNELYIINMGKQIDAILKEGIIYEESLDMKDHHALTMFRNASGDTVDANKADAFVCPICIDIQSKKYSWCTHVKHHDPRCPARQKYDQEGMAAIIIRD